MPANNAVPGILYGNMSAGTGSRGIQIYTAQIDPADPVALQSQNVSMLSMDQGGRVRVVLSNSSAGAPQVIQVRPLDAALANSPGTTARAVGPIAGAAIATILAASLPAGTYDVQVAAWLDAGAPVAADINNMEFRRGATVVSALGVLPVITIAGIIKTFRAVLDGATALSVNATGAATAGVGYSAELVATRIA